MRDTVCCKDEECSSWAPRPGSVCNARAVASLCFSFTSDDDGAATPKTPELAQDNYPAIIPPLLWPGFSPDSAASRTMN